MSHLNGPRINFWGGGSTNVDTANNEQYDESGSALINLSDASVTSDMSDEAVINELRQTSTDSSGNPTYAKGGWNYYGDHQLKLMNATVSSSGYPGEVSTRSDLVGMPVYLLGGVDPESGDGPYGGPVMVDLDPSSGTTTQIYAGGLIVGNPNEPVLLIRGNTIGHSRMIGLRYNSQKTSPPYNTPGSAYASAIFQFAFAKSDIVSYDQQHPLLKAMIESPASQGVIIRFSMFQFYPGYSAQHMKANYESNQNDANPSLGRIIGSIGPWYEGELATEPPGRQLTNADLGGAQGLAYLNESTNLLTLDLVSALEGSAIRQDGHQNTSAPEPNVDYGNLLVNAGNNTIAQTPSLPNDYYLYGGIYDVPVSAAAIQTLKTHPLTLGSSKNNLQINETPLRITCNQRNIYLDPGASAPSI